MRTDLSCFLQWRINIFIYQILGSRMTFFYITTLGGLYFFFRRKEKRKIREAVESVFSGRKNKSEIRSIARNVFRGIRSHYYEKLFNAYENIHGLKTFFEKSIKVSCLNKLDSALRRGKGVLFVTGHYGGVEYIPIFLALKKYPISAIAKFKTRELKDTLYLKTKDLGLKIIDANQKNRILRSIIQELKANRIVFIECDEVEEWKPSQKEKMPFLGKVIGVDKTIDLLQKRTGAEIIFGILHRFNLMEYSLIIETYKDMLLCLGTTPCSAGETVLKYFEKYIYSCPEEWYQWKKYPEINEAAFAHTSTERITHTHVFLPASGKVS